MAKSKTKDSLESLEKNYYFIFIIYSEYKIINKEYFFLFISFSLLKIFLRGFLCAALDVPELALRTRLTSN